jgi:pSer/pThr/pTyr-binding forkhead associated (FHA) protein
MSLWRGKRSEGQERYLVVLRLAGADDAGGKVHTLPTSEAVVGRDDSCTIQIVDPQISRRHFVIERRVPANTFWIRDLDSANGTLVDGQPVTEPRLLAEEEVIEIGTTQLLFTSRGADGQLRGLSSKRLGEGWRSTMPGGSAPAEDLEGDDEGHHAPSDEHQ